MSKYKVGQKFVIEIDSHMTNKHGELYGIKGFSTLVFDDFRLDRLEQFNGMTLRDAYDEGYEKGLRDAWECAKKITNLDSRERFDWFGGYSVVNIINKFSASEAENRIVEYKAKQDEITVGDEVVNSGDKGIVTCNNRDTCDVIWFDGSVNEELEKKFLRKTGRHYDINSILEQLKGTDDEHDK